MLSRDLNAAALVALAALAGSCGAVSDAAIDGGEANPGVGAAKKPAFTIDRVVYVAPEGSKPGCLRFSVSRNLDSRAKLDRLALNYVAFTYPDPAPVPTQGLLPGFYGDKLSCRAGQAQPHCTAASYVAIATLRRLCVDRDPRNPNGEKICGSTIGEKVEVRSVIDWTVTGQPNASVAQIVRKVETPQSATERRCS